MADMMFDIREEYMEQIALLLKRADLFELDRFLRIMVKHFWPRAYTGL